MQSVNDSQIAYTLHASSGANFKKQPLPATSSESYLLPFENSSESLYLLLFENCSLSKSLSSDVAAANRFCIAHEFDDELK